jgi:aspartyl-tRNA(Asn)/glutamyl-tRNA(Gln) amidotransferase subunit A
LNLKISALEYVEEVKNGNISAEEFMSATIDRIKNIDEKLHAFLQVNSKAIEHLKC